jgi:hypothetical protein
MLLRAKDVYVRMRILFGIVTCATWLNLDQIRENAIQELKRLPDFAVSRVFVFMAQARAYSDLRRGQEALDLIEANLNSEVLQREDFRDCKYEHLFFKGRSLVQLARYGEALAAFDAAHAVCPEGSFEADLLIERANCYLPSPGMMKYLRRPARCWPKAMTTWERWQCNTWLNRGCGNPGCAKRWNYMWPSRRGCQAGWFKRTVSKLGSGMPWRISRSSIRMESHPETISLPVTG